MSCFYYANISIKEYLKADMNRLALMVGMICSAATFPADVFDSLWHQQCVSFNGQADQDWGPYWGQTGV